MKKATKTYLWIAGTLFLALMTVSPAAMFAQKTKGTVMKIGTYDSRVVTFAWSRSDYFKEHLAWISRQTDSAQKAGDTARLKEVSADAISYQHLLHQMVFSKGSAGWIMELVKDKLPALAEKSGVIMIVSQWELPYHQPGIETVDLTALVAQLFNPKENIEKMSGDISKQPPVPPVEMTIETEMLDLFCQRFGKK